MRLFFAFNVLCLTLGLCLALNLDEIVNLNINDETARQSNLQSQIPPIFGVTFVASLINNILYSQFIANTGSTIPAATLATITTPFTTTTTTTSTTTTATPNTPCKLRVPLNPLENCFIEACRCGVKNTRIIGGSDVSSVSEQRRKMLNLKI